MDGTSIVITTKLGRSTHRSIGMFKSFIVVEFKSNFEFYYSKFNLLDAYRVDHFKPE